MYIHGRVTSRQDRSSLTENRGECVTVAVAEERHPRGAPRAPGECGLERAHKLERRARAVALVDVVAQEDERLLERRGRAAGGVLLRALVVRTAAAAAGPPPWRALEVDRAGARDPRACAADVAVEVANEVQLRERRAVAEQAQRARRRGSSRCSHRHDRSHHQ